MKIYATIRADTNDADYIKETNEVSIDDLPKFRKIVDVIKNHLEPGCISERYYWPSSEYAETTIEEFYVKPGLLTEEEVDFFWHFVPFGEYGVHNIDSIKLMWVHDEETLI